MGKGRGRRVPSRPANIIDELLPEEEDGIHSAAEALGVPFEAWPYMEELADFAVSIACERRIERHIHVDRVPKTSAFKRTATAFGLSVSAVRAAHYRRIRRTLEARKKCRQAEAEVFAPAQQSAPSGTVDS